MNATDLAGQSRAELRTFGLPFTQSKGATDFMNRGPE
jgi:hypothetical protein